VERQGGVALVSVDLPVAFVLIERLLGGSLGGAPPDRSLTPLERVVMRIVTDRVARELSGIWKDHVAFECAWSRFESTPELIEMTGRDDDVLAAVELGELSGEVRLALPFPVLESFFNRGPVRRTPSESVSPAERSRERSVAEFLVRDAATVVSAHLPPARIALRTLSELRPGDVLPTGIPAGTGVEVHVSGTPRFTAREGRLGPWVGVEITAPWKPASRPGKTNRTTLEFSHGG